jgi:membrane-associated phospholipid phosphatase
MNKLTNFFKEKSVLYLFIPFLILGFAFLLIYGKSQSHHIINGVHNNFGDFFFKYITHLGDGIIFPILIIVTLFLKFKWSLYFFTASLLTLLFMYLTKQLLFHGMPRPIAFFENLENLYLINGVKVHKSNSFPSGHTTTAFAIFTLLILITKNNYLKFTFALLAIIAGFSRIYLSQHFLIDVLAGAILGVTIALISCLIIDKICYKNKITLDERISVKFSIK